jgi:hypothetical protein
MLDGGVHMDAAGWVEGEKSERTTGDAPQKSDPPP